MMENKKRKCSFCKTDGIDSNLLFCPNCGMQLQEKKEEVNEVNNSNEEEVKKEKVEKTAEEKREDMINAAENISNKIVDTLGIRDDLKSSSLQEFVAKSITKILSIIGYALLGLGIILMLVSIPNLTIPSPWTETVNGTVLSIVEDKNIKKDKNGDVILEEYKYNYTYEYTYDTVVYKLEETHYIKTAEVGQTVTIYVNPENPSDSLTSSPSDLKTLGIFLIIFGASLSLVGGGLIFAGKAINKKAKKEFMKKQNAMLA